MIQDNKYIALLTWLLGTFRPTETVQGERSAAIDRRSTLNIQEETQWPVSRYAGVEQGRRMLSMVVPQHCALPPPRTSFHPCLTSRLGLVVTNDNPERVSSLSSRVAELNRQDRRFIMEMPQLIVMNVEEGWRFTLKDCGISG